MDELKVIDDYLAKTMQTINQLTKLQLQFMTIIGAPRDKKEDKDQKDQLKPLNLEPDSFTAAPKKISGDINSVLYDIRELVTTFHSYLSKQLVSTKASNNLSSALIAMNKQLDSDDSKLDKVTQLIGIYMREENFNHNDWDHIFLDINSVLVNIQEKLNSLQSHLKITKDKLR